MILIAFVAGVLQIVWLESSQNGLETVLKLMFYNIWVFLLLHFQLFIVWKEENWKQIIMRWGLMPIWILFPYI